MKMLLSIVMLLNTIAGLGQFPLNNKWIIGNSTNNKQQILLDFRGNLPHISLRTTISKFNCPGICPTIQDSLGEVQFYTNGRMVMNQNGELMENGDSFPTGLVEEMRPPELGNPFINNSFILPDFTNNKIYYYYYVNLYDGEQGNVYDNTRTSLYYLKIDMSKNGGLGAVVEKNVPVLLRDSLKGYSVFTPVRHANGRDWWFLTNEMGTNIYHRILWSPTGFDTDFPVFTVDGPIEPPPVSADLFGREISLDGSKYVIGSAYTAWVYDFDRCTGLLFNPIQLLSVSDNISSHFIEDASISNNNRYLYLSEFSYWDGLPAEYRLKRFDLWDVNPAASVEVFQDDYGSFYHLPNGQIAISRANEQTIHVLSYPDSTDIVIDSNYIKWDYPVTLFGMYWINPANYYLGPLDNSPCDTLGLDNNPLAHWRYDRKPNPMEIKFVDLTYYEPTYWHWDFGDGQSSTEQHPVHIFAQAGIYEVCLIVGNTNSADTLCKMVTVGDLLSVEIVADTLSGCIPLTIHYHADTVAANSLHWTFDGGNPSQSNSADVLVTYDTVGMYMVNLMATGIISEKTDSRIVNVSDGPVADYDFTVDGLKMTAMNMSTDATAYAWDFGDGKKSAAINPAHLYAAPGSYNIQLVAINGCGRDTITRNLIITGTNDLASIFSFSLYPNPNDGVFEITIQGKQPADIKFRIFDVLGRTIWTKTWAKRQRLIEKIDLKRNGHFPQGTYFYQLQYEHRLVTGKLFIE